MKEQKAEMKVKEDRNCGLQVSSEPHRMETVPHPSITFPRLVKSAANTETVYLKSTLKFFASGKANSYFSSSTKDNV